VGIFFQLEKPRYRLENLSFAGNLDLQSNVGACVFVNALSFTQISLSLGRQSVSEYLPQRRKGAKVTGEPRHPERIAWLVSIHHRHSPCGIAARNSTGQEFTEFGVFVNQKLLPPRPQRLRGEISGKADCFRFTHREITELFRNIEEG